MQSLPYTNGVYRTAPSEVSWRARTFPAITFYSQFLANVTRSASEAKRGAYDGDAWCRSSVEVLRSLEFVGVQFEISGVDHLKQLTTPCLVIGNHMGMMETTVLPAILQPFRDVTFIVKPSLMEFPVFKHVMRSRDPIAVTTTNPRQDLKMVLEGGTERLKRGISVMAFPQGKREVEFDPAKFNTLGIKLAKRAGVPIVPLALKTDAWEIGSWIKDLGRIDPSKKVRFAFGEPLSVEGRGADEHQRIVRFIQEHLSSWREEDRALGRPLRGGI
ncbi:MAG: lysophospholipid acyltransferase family protein [Verrucomicrobiales bacterium]